MNIRAPWKNFTKPEIAAACRAHGPVLDIYLEGTDDGSGQRINGASLLFAIAGNETTFGQNCHPRYEPSYDTDGKYANKALLEQFGSDAACSWGPFQIMLGNALGFTPQELGMDLDANCVAVMGYVHRYVVTHCKAITLDEIFDTYNSGNWKDRVTAPVEHYIRQGKAYYFTEVIS